MRAAFLIAMLVKTSLIGVVCLVGVACQSREATEAAKVTAAPVVGQECPLADPILDDIPVTSRSSIEAPLTRARMKPYEEWTEYDRGVVTKYLDAHFPNLEEEEVLGALFSSIPQAHPSEFRQWVQLRTFGASLVIYLLRNYTSLDVIAVNRLVRDELDAEMGNHRFGTWLEVATHFDRSPELTRHVVELLVKHEHPLLKNGSCRFGVWCNDHLKRDLTPVESAAVIREYAALGSDVVDLFVPSRAIFATDPDGFLREAAQPDMTGLVAAHLLLESGDLPRIEQFLLDSSINDDIRGYWAYRLAQDPPAGSAALLARLRDAKSPHLLIADAVSAPGSVRAPYVSCTERASLLAKDH